MSKIFVFLVGLLMSVQAPCAARELRYARTLSTSGSAEMKIVPDKAIIQISLRSSGQGFEKCLRVTDGLLAKVQKAATELNWVRCGDEVSQLHGVSKLGGNFLELSRKVSFETTRLKNLANFATKIMDINGVEIEKVVFKSSQVEAKKNALFTIAFRQAKTRAQFSAAQAGEKLGKISSISDKFEEDSRSSDSIQCDYIEMTGTVDVTYELADK